MTKRVFAVCFLVLMAVLGCASVAGYLSRHLAVPETGPDVNAPSGMIRFDPKERVNDSTGICLAFARYIVGGTGAYTSVSNPLYPFFQGIAFGIDDLLRNDVVINGGTSFVKLPNGYLTYLYPYSHPEESWENLADFVGWLRQRHTPFLAVTPADKGDDRFSQFPEGVPHGYSEMEKEYMEFLHRKAIVNLEAKRRLLAADSDFFSWFYRTDHHWNVHAGLLIARETAEMLNDSLSVAANADALQRDKFSLSVYPDCFQGSMGLKMGPDFKEDFEVLFPVDSTFFHVVIPGLRIDRKGPFERTVINRQLLSSRSSGYSAFLYGDHALVRIENQVCENTTRILVVKHSKADVMCTYLAMAVRYLDIIDPRHYNGSIREFICATAPDAVLTCIDIPYVGDEKSWRLK